jgi:SSS family solute:Na+ symporter
VGFAAILQVPGLTGPEIDLALFRLSLKTFSPWVVGVIGGAGVLTALVPGSLILLAAATLLSKNIYRVFRGPTSDAHISIVARWLVPVVALVSVYFTLRGGNTIVALLLMGYSFVTQFFPSVVMSLLRHNPVTKEGAFIGICVGVITVGVMSSLDLSLAKVAPTAPQAFQDLNIGIVALGLNIIATTVVSAVTRRVPSPHHA